MQKSSVQNQSLPKTSAAHLLPDFFQQRVLITPTEAGAACGWAKQTVYNRLSKDEFPFPLVEFAGRKMVRTEDLLDYISMLHAQTDKATKSKVGRPTKGESICRKSEKSGGSK